MGDANWFPTPPPKPAEDPIEATRLVTAGMLAIVAIVAIVLAVTNSHSHSHKPTAPAATTTTTRLNTEAERRAAFDACLKSAGVARGGRFGGSGSGDNVQSALALCSSLVGGDRGGSQPSLTPTVPPQSTSGGPPVA